jgi:hypothetical protein
VEGLDVILKNISNNGNVSFYRNLNNSNVIVGADFDFESLIVIRTYQKLEKDCYRLTSGYSIEASLTSR